MIYFIQAGETGPIKIGKANDPAQRINQFQTAHHETLRLLGSMPNRILPAQSGVLLATMQGGVICLKSRSILKADNR
jgi:hypothetical protein